MSLKRNTSNDKFTICLMAVGFCSTFLLAEIVNQQIEIIVPTIVFTNNLTATNFNKSFLNNVKICTGVNFYMGCEYFLIDLDKFGVTIFGKLSKLRRTQSIPTSLFSLIFWGVSAYILCRISASC
jgi:hypothetical protein